MLNCEKMCCPFSFSNSHCDIVHAIVADKSEAYVSAKKEMGVGGLLVSPFLGILYRVTTKRKKKKKNDSCIVEKNRQNFLTKIIWKYLIRLYRFFFGTDYREKCKNAYSTAEKLITTVICTAAV